MVKPGTNQVARRPYVFSKARMRCAPIRPNSPRDSGVGVVMPRAMKPDWVSKSKVRQTMWRGIGTFRAGMKYNIAHGHENDRHHRPRRDRAHLLDAAPAERAHRDPPRGRPRDR